MSMMGNEFSGLPIADLIGGPLTAACDAQVRLAKATADFINTVGFNPELDANNKPTGKLVPRQVDFSFWQPLPIAANPIQKIDVTNGGSGYTSVPLVTISGGGGTGATAVAELDGDKVKSITVTSGGSGYTGTPSVAISGGAGSGATATATVATAADSSANVQKVMLSVPFLAIVNVPALMVKTVDITFDMEVKSSESHHDSEDKEMSLDVTAKVGWGPFSAEVKVHGSVSAHQENTRSTDRSAKYHVAVHAADDGMPEGLSRVLDILQKAIAPVSVSKAVALDKTKIGQNQAAVPA